MLQQTLPQTRWSESGASLVMAEYGTSANQAEKLRGLLDRLRSGEIQLNDAKSLRTEVMDLIATDFADTTRK